MALLSVAADGLTTAQYAEQVARELERRMREELTSMIVNQAVTDMIQKLEPHVRSEVEKYSVDMLRYNYTMLTNKDSIDVVLNYKEGLCSTMD